MAYSARMRSLLMTGRRGSALFLSFTALWYIVFHMLVGRTDALHLSAWAWLPLLWLPLWASLTGIVRLRNEVGLVGAFPSNPVPSPGWWTVAGTNGTILLHLALYTSIVVGGAVSVFQRSLGVANLLDLLPIPAIDWFYRVFLTFLGLYAAICLALALTVQTAYLASRFPSRGRWFIGVWVTVMLVWTKIRAIIVLSPWFQWLPPIPITSITALGEAFAFSSHGVSPGPYVAGLLTFALLIATSGYLLDKLRQGHGVADESTDDAVPVSTGQMSRQVKEQEEQDSPPPVKTRFGSRPPRLPNLRERILILILAASALTLYDAFAHGLTVSTEWMMLWSRPVFSQSVGRGFYQNRPFLQKTGSFHHTVHPGQTIIMSGNGDLFLQASPTDDFTVQYAVRVYAESARHAQALIEHVDVRLTERGDNLILEAHLPETAAPDTIRVHYEIGVPSHSRALLYAEHSTVDVHDMERDVELNVKNSSVYATKLKGQAVIRGDGNDLAIVDGEGSLLIQAKKGVLEIHGHHGPVDITSSDSIVNMSTIEGNVTARFSRGLASLRRIQGDAQIDAYQARVQAVEVAGNVALSGLMSPMELVDLKSDARIITDRGNAVLSLAPDVQWDLDAQFDKGRLIQSSASPPSRAETEVEGKTQPSAPPHPEERVFHVTVRATRANLTVK